MYDTKYVKQLLEERLSKKRYHHSLNVADEAKKLALQYEGDPDKAYYSGLLHDICKEEKSDEMKRLIQKCEDLTKIELVSEKLWHGPAGAVFIQEQLGIKDKDIINAVRFHTIGRAGMTRLEEIVYLADLISKDRDYKDVDKMRKLAYSNLEKAMYEAICFSIINVIKKHGYVPETTIGAYNQYNHLYLVRDNNKEKSNGK